MNKYLLVFLLTLPTIVLSATHAGRNTGVVTGYIPYSNAGKEVFFVKITNSSTSGCNTTGRFAIDDDSERFDVTRSAVIAAYHAQTPVTIVFKASCDTWSNATDINYMCFGNIPC